MGYFKQEMSKQIRIRGLSPNTERVYLEEMRLFVRYFMLPPDKITLKQINEYQTYMVNRNVSWAKFNIAVCAIRFFYVNVLKRSWNIKHVPFQKKDLLCLQS